VPPAPPEDDLRVIALVGDEQIHQLPDYQGFFRSLLGNSVAPAHRLPASTLGVTHAFEALMRGGIPVDQMKIFEGMIATGDIADVANTEEMKIFFETLDRLKKADPLYRNLLFMIGNHDMLHAGVSRSGSDFYGLLGIVLRVSGTESYKKDIQIPEVGDRGKVLDKAVLIRLLYKYFFEKDPNPAELASSTYTEYSLKKGDMTSWDDTGQVFRDFWRQEKDGSWNALVHYLPAAKDKPEKAWIYASAVKMGDFQTSASTTPVYFVSLDTMDYLDDGMSLGALQGHVSGEQVRIVEAFIESVRASEPGAKFVLGGHFPVAHGAYKGFSSWGIAKVKDSGLYRILSDDDVVAYVAAHTHDRGYADLSTFKPIDRATPLPQVVVPAVMDYPNEMVLMQYGVEAENPDRLVFQFDFTGIDEAKVPGNSDAVCEELKSIRPHLLMYDDAIAHIKDDPMREFAAPETSYWKRADITLNLDRGVLTRFERAHDEIIKEDVIPGMVEDTQYYLRAFMSVLKLSYIEAGWEEEAKALEEVYLKNVDHLDAAYESIWKGEYRETSVNHDDVHVLDKYMADLDRKIFELEEKTHEALEDGGGLDPDKAGHLHWADHVLPLVRGYLGEYRYWLENYEQKLRAERGPRDFIYDADLGGSLYFKSVMGHMREVPYGSAPWAFIVDSFLEAGEQRVEFYGGEDALKKKVPDRIRLELDPATGGRTVVLSPLTKEDQKVKRRSWCQPDAPHFAEEARQATQATVVPTGNSGTEWHWSYRLGTVWQGSRLQWTEETTPLAGEFGGQLHLVNRWDRPRVNLAAHLGGTADFDGYWDVYGRVYGGIGDPWGLIEAGPVLKGGFVLSKPDRIADPADSFVAAGVNVSLMEGLVSFEASRMWHDEGKNDWRYFLNVDLATGLRALHWGGVAKWVERGF
jgi:hypothetical protein